MRAIPMIKHLLPILVALPLYWPLSAQANPERGRLFYENHCLACHESSIHIRETQAARSLEAVRAAVLRWQAVLTLGWGAEEVADVAEYLNATWYRYAE